MRSVLYRLSLVIALLLLAVPAHAQFNVLPEIRGGFSARGIDGGGNLLAPNRMGDANVELLFAIPDLRNRVLFTLALLGVYRIGSRIPTPGVNQEALEIFVQQASSTMFGLYNMFSGGARSPSTRATSRCCWR